MLLRLAILLTLAAALFGATSRLYLKDGEYHLVREYQVLQDRVRYYSTERGDWEEIPLELVDLDRTKKETAERQAELDADAKLQAQENAAVRAEKKEAARIPDEPGAYYIHGDKLEPVKSPELEIVSDKARNILKVLVPVPIILGRSNVEIKGETAPLKVADNAPEFYFRLSEPERFGIVSLTKKKNYRLVETVDIETASQEKTEMRKLVDTFKKLEGDALYKIWPEKPLPPGEYAVIQFIEGEVSLQVWDFSVGAAK